VASIMAKALKYVAWGIAALASGAAAAPYCAPQLSTTSQEPTSTPSPVPGPRTFEAEDAILTGTRVESSLAGYSGVFASTEHPWRDIKRKCLD
jgi:mannan endo-1,4-beta-mannosidase